MEISKGHHTNAGRTKYLKKMTKTELTNITIQELKEGDIIANITNDIQYEVQSVKKHNDKELHLELVQQDTEQVKTFKFGIMCQNLKTGKYLVEQGKGRKQKEQETKEQENQEAQIVE